MYNPNKNAWRSDGTRQTNSRRGGVPGTESADAVQRDGRVHGQRHVWHPRGTRAAEVSEASHSKHLFAHIRLWWICQSCLYFKSEHFKTTSGVSITVMLVMYTLYQSVSVKLPPTSYLKLVDVWLIFGLVLPFITFFILITVEHTPVGTTKTALSNFGKFILPVLILLFAATYFIVACVLYNTA